MDFVRHTSPLTRPSLSCFSLASFVAALALGFGTGLSSTPPPLRHEPLTQLTPRHAPRTANDDDGPSLLRARSHRSTRRLDSQETLHDFHVESDAASPNNANGKHVWTLAPQEKNNVKRVVALAFAKDTDPAQLSSEKSPGCFSKGWFDCHNVVKVQTVPSKVKVRVSLSGSCEVFAHIQSFKIANTVLELPVTGTGFFTETVAMGEEVIQVVYHVVLAEREELALSVVKLCCVNDAENQSGAKRCKVAKQKNRGQKCLASLRLSPSPPSPIGHPNPSIPNTPHPSHSTRAQPPPQPASASATTWQEDNSDAESQGTRGDPTTQYSIQHWSLIDDFIYFSHARFSIPPKQWTNAAHRNGIFVYATFITEWEGGVLETLKLVYGPEYDPEPTVVVTEAPADDSDDNPPRRVYPPGTFSPFFANKMIHLAQFYNFDGWFINIESDLGSPHHVSAVRDFLRYLMRGMHAAIAHAKVMWYDSLTIHGELAWQDRVTDENRDFLDACDALFVNYTWKQSYPLESAAIVQHSVVEQEDGRVVVVDRRKDVYFGIDVWGRNTFGGGGFDVHKALRETSRAGVSAAVFAPAWTFEGLGKEGFHENDEKLWRGVDSVSSFVAVRASGTRERFYTDFDRGFGEGYWMRGERIDAEPWFNLSRQSVAPTFTSSHEIVSISLTRLPSSELNLLSIVESSSTTLSPTCHRSITTTVSWNGGSCLQLNPTPLSSSSPAVFSWTKIPIQNIGVSSRPGVPLLTRIRFSSNLPSNQPLKIGISLTLEIASLHETIEICQVENGAVGVNGWGVIATEVDETAVALALESERGWVVVGGLQFVVTQVGVVLDWNPVRANERIWIGEVYVGSREFVCTHPQGPKVIEEYAFVVVKGEDATRVEWESERDEGCERWEVKVDGKWECSVYGYVFVPEGPGGSRMEVVGVDSVGIVHVFHNLLPDPFAVITVDGEQTKTTQVSKNTLNPHWNESFDVTLTNTSTITLQIFDHKQWTNHKNQGLLGMATYTIDSIFDLASGDGEEMITRELTQSKTGTDPVCGKVTVNFSTHFEGVAQSGPALTVAEQAGAARRQAARLGEVSESDSRRTRPPESKAAHYFGMYPGIM
ncbi:hypothetical protein HDU98_008173 [Podochytrium sp. JEL0797]|nr:hypothetical protein HDU98_008173 [Podochytrium sp. JEL0797]